MHTPLNLDRGIESPLEPETDVFAAAQRMIELAEQAIPNLIASREVSFREVSSFASEFEVIRRALERLADNPADLSAATHLDRALSLLDRAVSPRLWALNAASADEWRSCCGTVFKRSTVQRQERGYLGRHYRNPFAGLREWSRSLL